MTVKRIDFCDPQAGKEACDQKSADIKSHMKVYLNWGNNSKTLEEMKAAIQSFGEMSSVRVTSCGPPKAATFSNLKLEGVSSISSVVQRQGKTRLQSIQNWPRKTRFREEAEQS